MIRKTALFASVLLFAFGIASASHVGKDDPVRFLVRIENVSASTDRPVSLTSGVWAVHNEMGPIFVPGRHEAGEGLEALAERGRPEPLARALAKKDGVLSLGVFGDRAGSGPSATIAPGQKFEFTVTAVPGTRLSLATRVAPSPDFFLSPDDTGIALFDGMDRPVEGDVTSRLIVWDAGTEEVPEPGAGMDPAVADPEALDGDSFHGVVRPVPSSLLGRSAAQLIRVTIVPKR